MPARSHIDLCLYIQVLEIDEDKIPNSLKSILLDRNLKDIWSAVGQLHTDDVDVRDLFIDDETNNHESIHVAQAVIYPYLRWYAMSTYQSVVDVFRNMDDLIKMNGFSGGTSIMLPAFNLLDVTHYIFETVGGTSLRPTKYGLGVTLSLDARDVRGRTPVTQISAVDLIENAASLIQCRISLRKDNVTWREFERWSKRNNCYSNVLLFVQEYLGCKEIAVRLFTSLVQVSFETNKPVLTFVTLLAGVKCDLESTWMRDFLAQGEPCRWIHLFDEYLSCINFDEPEYGDVMSPRYFRLDRYDTSNYRIGGVISHPIIGYYTKLWGELERDDPSYRYVFNYPNSYVSRINKIVDIFNAPIAILKFTVSGENIILLCGDIKKWSYANLKGITETSIKGLFIDTLVQFGVVRRLSNALMDDDFRLCHHTGCPLYEDNLCNTWIFVPKEYRDCGFPERMKYVKDSIKPHASLTKRFKFIFNGGSDV